jgi:hypothetical protein
MGEDNMTLQAAYSYKYSIAATFSEDLLEKDTLQHIDTIDTEDYRGQEPKLEVNYTENSTTCQEIEVDGTEWISETLSNLIKIAKLPDNWDGYGSPGTKNSVVDVAIILLLQLAEIVQISISTPFVSPVPGGTFQLEWTSDNKYLEIEFIDEQHFAYLKEESDSSGEKTESDELSITRIDKIKELLDWFAPA